MTFRKTRGKVNDMKLESGKFYWWRHEFEKIWRICYIYQDYDDNQWLDSIGWPTTKLSDLDLNCFEFIEIPKPIT